MLAAASLARAGATMVGLTMGFVAYEQSQSALIVAIVVSAFGLAFALASLVTGHVLQRVGLRAMLVGALVSQIAGALALASVTSTAGADATWLTIFGFTNGLASAFLFVGSQMLLHGLAPSEHLQRVVSLDAAGASLSRILGPAVGGVLLAVIGIPPVFLIVAVCYVPLIVVTAVLARRVNDPAPTPVPEHRPRLREAARLYRQLPLLRWTILTAALAETLALPLVNMMPAVTESLNRDAADRLGILVACIAVGSVGQVLLIQRLDARHDTRVVVGIAYAAAGALLLGIAIDEELFVAGFLLVAFGLTVSIGRTLLLTSVHVASPDSHRAHVLSLYIFVTAAATPIGALIWGAVANLVGIDPVVGGAGVILTLGIAAGLVSIVRKGHVVEPDRDAHPVPTG
ncbi:MAG TPA: MFS transporter [Acidimicrobiia bacterium]